MQRIVIIGSGIAGVTFAERYRALMPDDEVILVTSDDDGYYSRPLLSRGFTKADIEQSIILKQFDQLRNTRIDVRSGTQATTIDRPAKRVTLVDSGESTKVSYDKLILAQGSAAFIPPNYKPYEKLFFCLNDLRDLKAMRRFRQAYSTGAKTIHWAVVGGGLIGCEIASDLAVAGDRVTVYHAKDRLMDKQLLPDDSALLFKVLTNSGVNVLLNQSVEGFAKDDDGISVKSNDIQQFDALIIACGFQPRTDLAMTADLAVDRGILVNDFLQTSDEVIFAVGDGAQLPNGKLYAYIIPIRSQALWLANYLSGQDSLPWSPAAFSTKAKVHGFSAQHPYQL